MCHSLPTSPTPPNPILLLTHHIPLVLPIYTWVWDHLLEHGKPLGDSNAALWGGLSLCSCSHCEFLCPAKNILLQLSSTSSS